MATVRTTTAITNTTQTKTLRVVACAVALGLVALSGPVLVARLLMLPGNEARESVLEGQRVSALSLNDFIDTRLKVYPFYKSNEVLNDLALGLMAQATQIGLKTPAARPKLIDVVRIQRMALARSPADTYGWARLAHVTYLLEGAGSRSAALALSQSLAAAPYEPRLMLSRLNLALSLWGALDKETRDQVPALMREAWKIDPVLTEAAARRGGYESQLLAVLQSAQLK